MKPYQDGEQIVSSFYSTIHALSSFTHFREVINGKCHDLVTRSIFLLCHKTQWRWFSVSERGGL